jgi:FK506-binding nuclear protein
MALALSVIRFKSDTFAVLQSDTIQNESTVVASADADNETTPLEATLRDSITTKGELMKLVIDDVRIGTGPAAENDDTVTVNYIGATRDGVQFDNSYVRGEPFSFTIGENKVIKGWEEGLVGMKVGGQRILVIPPEMAYGSAQVGPIPANSALVFTIELLEIK